MNPNRQSLAPGPCSWVVGSSPFLLLVRIALISSWRRLLSLREQSWFLLAVIATFLVGYLALAFAIFYGGLNYISKFPGLGGLLVERLLFVLEAASLLLYGLRGTETSGKT